jgi:hypothetical protein
MVEVRGVDMRRVLRKETDEQGEGIQSLGFT